MTMFGKDSAFRQPRRRVDIRYSVRHFKQPAIGNNHSPGA